MKKWFVGLLALILLCTVACRLKRNEAVNEPGSALEPQEMSEPTAEPTPDPTEEPSCLSEILGDWEITSVEIDGKSCDPGTVGMMSELSFYPNGAGELHAWVGEDRHGGIFTFIVTGNTITIFDETNDAQTIVYDPETDTLRMEHGTAAVVLVRKTDEASEGTPDPTEEPDWKSAQLTKTDDEGYEMIEITAAIPAGATLRIPFPHQDDYSFTNTEDTLKLRTVRIPVEVFFPNEPLADNMLRIEPSVTITTADGVEYEVECPSFEHVFPMLLLAIDSEGETSEDAYNVKADKDGIYRLVGTLLSDEDGMPAIDTGVRLTINGTETEVYEGGVFHADLKLVDNAPTTYTLVAEKDNYMTVTVRVIVSAGTLDT